MVAIFIQRDYILPTEANVEDAIALVRERSKRLSHLLLMEAGDHVVQVRLPIEKLSDQLEPRTFRRLLIRFNNLIERPLFGILRAIDCDPDIDRLPWIDSIDIPSS